MQQISASKVAQPHSVHVLWALSDHYLKCSANVLSCPNLEAAQSAFQQFLTAAVRCLEAVLVTPSLNQTSSNILACAAQNVAASPSVTLSPTAEIKTRMHLVQILISYTDNHEQAEAHLQKAVHKIKRTFNSLDLCDSYVLHRVSWRRRYQIVKIICCIQS